MAFKNGAFTWTLRPPLWLSNLFIKPDPRIALTGTASRTYGGKFMSVTVTQEEDRT